MTTILLTERLILRPFRVEDAEAVTRLCGEFEVARWMSLIPHPYRRSDADEWLERIVGYDDGSVHQIFAITRREDGVLIGCIGLHGDEDAPWAEFGYWLGLPYWGKGYATEALRELLRFGFENRGLRRIEACHFAENAASGRVMQKVGMTYEGMQRLRLRREDQLYDRINYGLIAEDWRAAEANEK